MGHGLLGVYMCSSRYSGSYPCSAFQYYSSWIILPIVVVIGLFTHQGYRYRRRRRSSFSSDDTVQGEALLSSARGQAGLPPVGGEPPGYGPAPAAAGFIPTAPATAPPGVPPSTGPTPAEARPPGWYPDPDRPGQQRYWYGSTWAPSLPPEGAPGPAPSPPDDAPGWGAASY